MGDSAGLGEWLTNLLTRRLTAVRHAVAYNPHLPCIDPTSNDATHKALMELDRWEDRTLHPVTWVYSDKDGEGNPKPGDGGGKGELVREMRKELANRSIGAPRGNGLRERR